MFVSCLPLLIFLHVEFTAASEDRDPEYQGYNVDQQRLENYQPYNITQEDTCLIRCRHHVKRFALISNLNCFCGEEDPSSNSTKCTRSTGTNQTCYKVLETDVGFCDPLEVPEHGMIDHYLFRVGKYVTFSCLSGYELNGSSKLKCQESDTGLDLVWSGEVPTCEKNFFKTLWFRIIIDVAAVIVVLLIIIIVFLVARHIRRRRQGMFHRWKPHTYRSANLASAILRSEGSRVRFQNQPNLSASAPVSDSHDGQGSTQIVEGNAISTPEIASGSEPVPAAGEGAPADIPKRNSVAVMISEMHTSATANVVSEKRDQNKATVENSPVAISPTPKHEQQGFNMSPVPKEGRPGSISELDADEPKSSEDTHGSLNTTMDRESSGTLGSKATSNGGASAAVVRPKSSVVQKVVSDSIAPAITINGEEPSPVNATVHQENIMKDRKSTPSSPLQNNWDSNLTESISLETEDNAPVKELASVMKRFKLSSSSLRAARKPKVATRRHTLQPAQIDKVAHGAANTMVSEPVYAMTDEKLGMNAQSEVTPDGSTVDDLDKDKDYCSLRVGPLDNHPEGRESKPVLLEDGTQDNQHVDRRTTVIETDDTDYAQLRVEKSDAYSDLATSGRPDSEVVNLTDKQVVEETSTDDPYEIVKIGSAYL